MQHTHLALHTLLLSRAHDWPCRSSPKKAAEASGVDKAERSKWTALAMEVANSRGLCLLAEAAQKFSGEGREATTGREDNEPSPDAAATAAAAAVVTTPGKRAGSVSETAPEATGRRRSSTTQDERATRTAAEKAAKLIATGCKAGDLGAHPTQKMNGAMLEALAWSLTGRGNAEGASLLFRGYVGGRGWRGSKSVSKLRVPCESARKPVRPRVAERVSWEVVACVGPCPTRISSDCQQQQNENKSPM